MTVLCPVCRGAKRARCLPCRGRGKLTIISPAEAPLMRVWMPVDRVPEAKRQQRAHGEAA
jgi:hypothetical protein